jgi:hypothetical protein
MVGGMGIARIARRAVLLAAAGVAVATAARRRGGDVGLAQGMTGRPPERSGADPHPDTGSIAGVNPEAELSPVVQSSLAPEVSEVEVPPVEVVVTVERSPEEPPVEEPPVEEPPVEAPPVEEPSVDEPPAGAAPKVPQANESPEAQQPPASVTDIVDDLLAPYRDRDAPIEDATVVEGPSGKDPERRTRT